MPYLPFPPPPPCTCLPPLPLYSLVQLVMYPILNLQLNHRSDLHWYMRSLEQVVIQVGEGEGEGCCCGMREGREWDERGRLLLSKIAPTGRHHDSIIQWCAKLVGGDIQRRPPCLGLPAGA